MFERMVSFRTHLVPQTQQSPEDPGIRSSGSWSKQQSCWEPNPPLLA